MQVVSTYFALPGLGILRAEFLKVLPAATCCASFSGSTLADLGGGIFLPAVAGLDPGVVEVGLRSPLCGVGMRLGVVLPPLGVGRRLRGGRLLEGSLYMFGEEDEMFLAPRNPLGPLGGRDAVGGSTLLGLAEPGVLVRIRDGCSLACTVTKYQATAQIFFIGHTFGVGMVFLVRGVEDVSLSDSSPELGNSET